MTRRGAEEVKPRCLHDIACALTSQSKTQDTTPKEEPATYPAQQARIPTTRSATPAEVYLDEPMLLPQCNDASCTMPTGFKNSEMLWVVGALPQGSEPPSRKA